MSALNEHSKPVRLAATALHAALADDWDKARRAIIRISDECGSEGLNIAVVGWIDTYVAHSADGDMSARVGPLLPINALTGSTSTEGMPAEVAWSIRLITARAAMDQDAYKAVLDELPEEGLEVGRHISALLQCVAGTINGLPRGYALMGRGER